MLKRAYIEITNICNLSCSFCPGTRRPPRTMTPEEFRRLAEKLRGHVGYLYFHVMGEPLLHPRLGELLGIAGEYGFRVCLTTNGTLLERRGAALLAAPALHKISVSLHAMEGNGAGNLTKYLSDVWDFALRASAEGIICALRLWNIGGADRRNEEILDFFADRLGAHPLSLPQPRLGSWRLGERLYLNRRKSSTGRTWTRLRPEPASAWGCGIRWPCWWMARWRPAAWITRGISSWGTCSGRSWRRSWPPHGPPRSMTASPRAAPARSSAAAAVSPGDSGRRACSFLLKKKRTKRKFCAKRCFAYLNLFSSS